MHVAIDLCILRVYVKYLRKIVRANEMKFFFHWLISLAQTLAIYSVTIVRYYGKIERTCGNYKMIYY